MNNLTKICLINQPAGFGDVFFLQKIVSIYIDKGYKVIYPLLPQTLIIKDYVKKPNLEFVSVLDDFPYKEYFNYDRIINTESFVYLPLGGASKIKPIFDSVLEVKYEVLGIDYSDWADFFNFERNYEKENELFYNILKIKDGEEYQLISTTFGTQPNSINKQVPVNENLRQIKISFVDGYNIFDWCKVIENAKEISIVDTSLNYIIEKLNLRANKLLLTSRFTPPFFGDIKNLFNKNWCLQDK